MDLNYLRKLVKIFDDSSLDDLTIEEGDSKIKFSRKPANSIKSANSLQDRVEFPQQSEEVQNFLMQKNLVLSEEKIPIIPKTDELQSGFFEQKAPMVGTFYRASSPDVDPYVEVGQHISKGQTLCIIEAMKLMNEIESDVSGTIEKIVAENGTPVEYGQTLFLIRAD
ncbi:MAG TPA: acetyl-CoA carboxylase biotin carboxyl carrier protein [Bacteroidetes bacterium]|nr:acetyl-CoA carboxylase biotin carboxyl carrier protein [Bacteroidota bacterium]